MRAIPLALIVNFPRAVSCLPDEIKSDITRETPASFESTMDHIVAKIPRLPSKDSGK